MKSRAKQSAKRLPGARRNCSAKAHPKLSGDEQMAKLRRELRAAKKRAAIAEVDRTADAQIVKNVETELANLLGLIPPIGVLTELKRLCSEVLATRETIKLVTNRMGEALGDTAGPPTTTGRMLSMVERLLVAQGRLRAQNQSTTKLLNELTTDRDAANDLIARLAFNLTRGPDQERIENASPAEHRAIVEAEALKLVELSLKLEMAEPRLAAPEDANNRVLAAEMRWEQLYWRLFRDVADIIGQDPGTGSELIGCLEAEFKRLRAFATTLGDYVPRANARIEALEHELGQHLPAKTQVAQTMAAVATEPIVGDLTTCVPCDQLAVGGGLLPPACAACQNLANALRDAEEDCAALAGVANHYAPDNLIEVELVRLTSRTSKTLTDDDLRALFAAHCECRLLDLSRADDDHSHDCDTAILRDAQRAMGFVGTPEQHLADIRAGDDAEKARIRCVEHWNRDVESEIYVPRLGTALTNRRQRRIKGI